MKLKINAVLDSGLPFIGLVSLRPQEESSLIQELKTVKANQRLIMLEIVICSSAGNSPFNNFTQELKLRSIAQPTKFGVLKNYKLQ